MNFKLTTVVLTLSLFMLSACLSIKHNRASSTPESPTAFIDGKYAGPCFPIDIDSDATTDGLKVLIEFTRGSIYSAYQVFDHDTSCTGASSLLSPDTGAPVSGLELTASDVKKLQIVDAPAGFYVFSGVDSIAGLGYNMIYKNSATGGVQLLADAIASNHGTTWSSWVAASVDAAGFAADPTGYTPGTGGGEGGTDSSNIPLTKVTSFF